MAIINGNDTDETLSGTPDADSIDAGGGNDVVFGGGGDDLVLGDTGNDALYGEGGNDTLLGGAGNDQLDGGLGSDSMDAGDGDDRFLIRDTDTIGADTIIGGAGADTLNMLVNAGWNFTFGAVQGAGVATSADGLASISYSGLEAIITGSGNDTVNGANAGAALNLITGAGADSVLGSTYADAISAGDGADTVDAGAGNDTVTGGGGNDTILGNDGNDLIISGSDNTANQVNTGDDYIDGGTGNDEIYGQDGNDTILGGLGNDQLDGGPGSDSMDGGVGEDRFLIRDTDINGNDTIAGGADTDTLILLRTDDWTVVYGPGQGTGFGISENLGTTAGFTGIETLFSGSGDDLIRGNNAGSAINVRANDGADTVFGSAFADVVDGGTGADSLIGLDGNDTLNGAEGDDYIDGGAGGDDLHGRTGNDTIAGGDGNDVILGWEDNDSLLGGEGNDYIFGDSGNSDSTLNGNDYIDAGAGDDRAWGGSGNDTVLAGAGNDTVYAEADNDEVHGQDGNDWLWGGAGNDSLYGDANNDTLRGDDGNDLLDGGADADTLTGGAGNDTFIAGSGDLINDFNAGNTGSITDGDQTNNDFVDLSGYYNDANLALWNAAHPDQIYHSALGWMRADQADDGVLNMLDGSNGLPSLTMTIQNSGQPVTGAELTHDNTNVPCFAAGTMIETDQGLRAVQDLAPGDLVQTRDNGLQAIRWAGSRALSAADLAANPRLQPIRICAGALGQGLPETDLLVSPQHRVLVRSKIARRMFGADEVLVAARQLCQIDGIDVADDVAEVTYHHIMFDRHEVVISNGAATESLFTGPEALKSVGPAARDEIFALFPELAGADHVPASARLLASGRMGRKLAVRHVQNTVALVN